MFFGLEIQSELLQMNSILGTQETKLHSQRISLLVSLQVEQFTQKKEFMPGHLFC